MARQRAEVFGRELLDRRYDDTRAALQRILQLSRGAVDLLDHAFGLLELRDGILKLAVQHDAIGHDDGRTENPRVGGSIPPPGTIFINNLTSMLVADIRRACNSCVIANGFWRLDW